VVNRIKASHLPLIVDCWPAGQTPFKSRQCKQNYSPV
jgi:hypothetical protein